MTSEKARRSMVKAREILARRPPGIERATIARATSREDKLAMETEARLMKLERIVRLQAEAIDRLRRWGH